MKARGYHVGIPNFDYRKGLYLPMRRALDIKAPIDAKASLKERLVQAKADAKYAAAPIKVVSCRCGRVFSTELEAGIVECPCGVTFNLTDKERIVVTVQPKHRSKG